MSDFLVDRKQFRETRVSESERPELQDGQALLEIESFGLTANNVTYAVFGELMNYWEFFPSAEDGMGRVPMWGFARIAEGERKGQRVYGYLPPSSHLVVTPSQMSDSGFVDHSEHRRALPGTYQRYTFTDTDPFYRDHDEALQMLLRPLFFTSFLIDDQLADDGHAATGPVLVASASSKTAIGAAYLLAQREDAEVIGLTSSRNKEFVEGLGIYSRTVTYDDIGSLEPGPATFVDISGDGEVRQAVHSHFGDQLAYSMAVGVTHWEEMAAGAALELQGPAPIFFFAPDRVDKRSEDWGAGELADRVAQAWFGFADWAGTWLEVRENEGFEGLEQAWPRVVDGDVAPSTADVIRM